MVNDSDLERLKTAYRIWHDTKGEEERARGAWLELFGDQFRIVSMGDQTPEIEFARTRQSKSEMVDYFFGLLKDWKMVHWSPDTFVKEGNHIAVFGRTAWTNRATGKTADVLVAHLWTFDQAKAVNLVEVFDSARAVAAATP